MAHLQSYNKDNPLKNVGNNDNNNDDVYSQCRADSIGTNMIVDDDDDKCFNILPLLNYGICVPDTCTEYDVRKMFQFCKFSEIIDK